MTILEKLERKTASGHFPRTCVNPDGPEASALIRELVGALERSRPYVANVVTAEGLLFNQRDLQMLDEALSKVKPLSSPLGSDTDG